MFATFHYGITCAFGGKPLVTPLVYDGERYQGSLLPSTFCEDMTLLEVFDAVKRQGLVVQNIGAHDGVFAYIAIPIDCSAQEAEDAYNRSCAVEFVMTGGEA